ncbi:putative phloem protein [Helianthus annuus]|uniref:Phloem protein n=1 Tax=Helianthus annuus TaxID=4232 RepID=A0A251TKE6_HELAN|nr:putative F-box protein PP2-B12 [Helianthus annuus]KAF5786335.1 putative phloem protein [Helianthus annuus]KAJ0513769.1 putative phloem protein [Helianthus annuus]KAJ0521682.1 putative phloem protein [Helianthus annuus]KAJ0529876.1 putative phloem protein [Helianthus annuus]KAJ0696748.1 putative phloem protein [Helianthus annuus]
MEEDMKDFWGSLPEGFVAQALGLTTPQDASRLSCVNSFFRSAAEWDTVWASFLPPECLEEAVEGGRGLMKEVYLRLCDNPILIEEGTKSFWLDKLTGKKCYMLAAKQLSIALIDSPNCWRWTSMPDSRFTEVAELINACSLGISGNVNTSILSPNTTYVAHLVFMATSEAYGFEYHPVEVCFGPYEKNSQTRMVYLDPQAQSRRRLRPKRRIGIFGRGIFANYDVVPPPCEENCPKPRQDGWFEVEIGEYFNKGGDEVELEMSVMEVKGGNWKRGLIIHGIEIRPKKMCIS